MRAMIWDLSCSIAWASSSSGAAASRRTKGCNRLACSEPGSSRYTAFSMALTRSPLRGCCWCCCCCCCCCSILRACAT